MKIAFNGYFLKGMKSGIGRYSDAVLAGLRLLDKDNEYQLIDNAKKLNKFIFEQIYLPIKLLLNRPRIYFSPSIILPYLFGMPSILVVYDLIFDLFPEYYRGKINLLYLKLFFSRSLRRATKIIAISESTKNDLIRLYGVPKNKIDVIYLAAADNYEVITDKARLDLVKKRYGLPDNYILFVGTIEPRKNVKGLLEAYSMLPSELRQMHPLVICGQKGWGYDQLCAYLTTQSNNDRVIFLDYVAEDDLPALYNMAKLFIYPSLYEGFGLPILEAMACGVPTITSNVSSMPEVVGGAAILVDPNDIMSISDKILYVLENERAADDLRRLGFIQARKYSWRKTAQQTLALIKEVANSK